MGIEAHWLAVAKLAYQEGYADGIEASLADELNAFAKWCNEHLCSDGEGFEVDGKYYFKVTSLVDLYLEECEKEKG